MEFMCDMGLVIGKNRVLTLFDHTNKTLFKILDSKTTMERPDQD